MPPMPSLPVCTFSRVMKEKGIEEAVRAIESINNQYKRQVYALTIYGQVDPHQIDWFEKLQQTFPSYIKYGGMVPFDKSTEILKDYFALLFPTYYEGEGFAGTLIDALAAGVPVIASDWHYNAEIVLDEKTGLVHKTKDDQGLKDALERAYLFPQKWNEMKLNCIRLAHHYVPEKAIAVLTDRII